MQMRLDQIAVGEVDGGRADDAAHHRLAPAKVILIVRTLRRAVGQDQRRLARTAGTAGALRIIRWRRRHVAQVDGVERRDIDAELHGRRAEQHRQEDVGLTGLAQFLLFLRELGAILLAPTEPPFAPFAPLGVDLRSVLSAFDAE